MHRIGRVISNCQTLIGTNIQNLKSAQNVLRHLSAQPQSSRKPDYNTSEDDYFITFDKINPNIKVMEYIVRGPIVIRAAEIENEIKQVRQNYSLIVSCIYACNSK